MKFVGSRILKICVLLVIALMLLAGCEQIVTPSQPTLPSYTVTFLVNGQVHREQRVQEGSFPTEVSSSLQGIQVLGWKDEAGSIVDPVTVAVTGDVTYQLAYYPELSRHVPYLFANEHDQLRPDDVLTEVELKQALEAVAAGGAKAYFPELPDSGSAVDWEFLSKILLHFFPRETVQAAVPGSGSVKRAAFAAVMNELLRRDTEKPVALADGAVIPVDVTFDRVDAVHLLEAALAHTESEDGIGWTEVDLPTTLEPGFVNLDGYLYYITEDRYFLKDDNVGDLYFGADGRYTCGDRELDDIVADILKKLMEENPEKTGLELLRVVHEYCRDSFKYLRRYDNAHEVGETGWAVADGKEMFVTGRGNCYNYAAAFWALSRGLGWETYAISGTCTKTVQPHGWCLINIDGEDYFFDCEWEMAYRVQHDPPRYEMDMFMIPMDKVSYWSYRWTTY